MICYTKRNKIGFLALLMLALLLLQLLSGCSDPGAGAAGTDGADSSDGAATEDTTAGTEDESALSTEADTDNETEAANDSAVPISELSNYRIIYREDGSERELDGVLALQSAIYDTYGVLLETREDFVREGTAFVESEYEILVGRCARDAAIEFCESLRAEDYGYCVSGKKIVIAGTTGERTADAVEAFIADAVGKREDVLLSSKDAVTVRGEYELPPVYLNDAELCEYTVVYPDGDARMEVAAEYFAELLRTFGYFPLVKSDGGVPCGHEILIGETSRGLAAGEALAENEYSILASEAVLLLAGGSPTMVYRAISDLADRITDAYSGKRDEHIRLTLDAPIRVTCSASSFRAMSFNIRCAEFTEDRIALVFRMIDLYAPDTIGFQEATVDWMNRLKAYLGDRYGCVGVGRNADHSGEASPVFYLKSKFELLEGGTRWMTSTPDTAGSKIPESSLPRVYSYAVLKTLDTGVTFVHVNTHLEHTSEEAREIQAGYLVEFLKRYNDEGMSYIVTGDFNCERGAGSYNVMTNFGLSDALYIAEDADSGLTYHGYGKTSKVIDHIFVSEGIPVSYYKACTETFKDSDGNIAYPSDHNPVIIDYEIV